MQTAIIVTDFGNVRITPETKSYLDKHAPGWDCMDFYISADGRKREIKQAREALSRVYDAARLRSGVAWMNGEQSTEI